MIFLAAMAFAAPALELRDFQEAVEDKLALAESLHVTERATGELLERPAGTWLKLVCSPRECLFYKTEGRLRFVRGDNPYAGLVRSLGGVRRLRVEREPFKTVLSFEWEHKAHRWEIPHYNVPGKAPYGRHDSPVPQSYRTGLVLGRHPRALAGMLEDGAVCHKVDGGCREVVKNTCRRCRSGHYEVVDFRCPQGGSKFCGPDRCGERGRPACPRGWSASGASGGHCRDGLLAGFCRRGLQARCDPEGILFCR